MATVQAAIVEDVRVALAREDMAGAARMVTDYVRVHGETAEALLALSWIGRGKLGRDPAGALANAEEVRRRVLEKLKGRTLDAGKDELALAFGASIEVNAQALAATGRRSEAVAFLNGELARWRGTSIRARVQKNLNLLTLEGRVAPPLEIGHWVGPLKPVPLSALRGHPVLLFFWAHWCGDCKIEISTIQQLNELYGARGLKIVGPTMHFGYVAGGEEAPVEKETAWIEQTRQKYYARIGEMAVPVSAETLRVYGVSTTPTIALVDKKGIVRLYHPGRMSFEELSPLVEKVIGGS